jgi:hypothetical protein
MSRMDANEGNVSGTGLCGGGGYRVVGGVDFAGFRGDAIIDDDIVDGPPPVVPAIKQAKGQFTCSTGRVGSVL